MHLSRFKFFLPFVLVTLAFNSLAETDDSVQPASFEKGLAAYEKGDRASALMMWFPLAESGNVQAQLRLAKIYMDRNDIPVALQWYRRAAEGGSLEAQTTLGLLYWKGERVEKDPQKAARYLLMATRGRQAASRPPMVPLLELSRESSGARDYLPMASRGRQAWMQVENAKQQSPEQQAKQAEVFEQGMAAYRSGDYAAALMHWLPVTEQTPAEALYMIGRLYLEQNNALRNPEKAEYWMTQAAEKGHLPAQSQLGLMYFEGEVFEQDLALAARWLLEASSDSGAEEADDVAAQAPAEAQDNDVDMDAAFSKGMLAYHNKDYATALLHWYPLAVAGHVNAQYMMGDMYLKEADIYQNRDQAMEWYKRAIARGDIHTTRDLALMYLRGNHLEKNPRTGLALLLRAARLGDVNAQYMLGNMYSDGEQVRVHQAKAAYWYQKAAEQGHPDARFALAEIFMHGKGVARNRDKALHWYREASKSNHQQAALILAKQYYLKSPKPNYRKAFELFSNAAKQGETEAQYYLGKMYLNGQGTAQNYEHAFEWSLKAATMGHTGAEYSVGKMYVNGYGVKRDFRKGVDYFSRAAKKGHGNAQKDLAVAYYTNQGVERDPVKAYAWFYLASQKSVEGADISRNRVYKSLSVTDQKRANEVVVEFKKAYP